MKANYEEDKVIVSATEPTEVNRKKVWFKKGKNLINIKEVLPGTLNNNTGEYMNTRSTIENITDNSVTFKLTSNWAGVVFFINVLPNTTYTLKFDSTIAEITGNVNDNFVLIDTFNNVTYKRRVVKKSGTTHSFTTQENENEVRICIETGKMSALNINITLSNIQLEQNAVATAYEQYIEPEIYILNNNNVYEKFEKDENKEKILFEGSVKFGNNVCVIPDDIRYVEVYFKIGINKNSIRIDTSYTPTSTECIGTFIACTGTNFAEVEMNFNANRCLKADYIATYANLNSDAVNKNNTDGFEVYKVVGYK